LTVGGLERGPLLFNTVLRLALLLGAAWLADRLRGKLAEQP
jgi:hypothetical protein